MEVRLLDRDRNEIVVIRKNQNAGAGITRAGTCVRLAGALVFLAVGACGSDRPEPGAVSDPAFELGSPIEVAAISTDSLEVTPEGSPSEFIKPADVVVYGDGVAVLEGGEGRVVLLDGSRRIVGRVGRRGAGPGEMRLGLALAAGPSAIFVNDVGLQRILILSPEGEELGVMANSFGTFHTAAADSVVYAPIDSMSHYAARLTTEGATLVAPRRANSYQKGETVAPVRIAVDRVGRLHVFDERLGCLLRYANDGAEHPDLVRCMPPGAMTDSLRASAENESLKGRPDEVKGRRATQTKRLSVNADGSLLLLFNAAPVFGLVIDAGTYAARPLTGVGPREFDGLSKTRAAVIRGDSLYALVGEFLVAKALRR